MRELYLFRAIMEAISANPGEEQTARYSPKTGPLQTTPVGP
jgi:hypothetical protein